MNCRHSERKEKEGERERRRWREVVTYKRINFVEFYDAMNAQAIVRTNEMLTWAHGKVSFLWPGGCWLDSWIEQLVIKKIKMIIKSKREEEAEEQLTLRNDIKPQPDKTTADWIEIDSLTVCTACGKRTQQQQKSGEKGKTRQERQDEMNALVVKAVQSGAAEIAVLACRSRLGDQIIDDWPSLDFGAFFFNCCSML